MVGVVLCGGQSVRMGNDKGLISSEGITWAQAAVSKLSAFEIPVCVSVNEQQYASYAETFSNNSLITDNPALQLHGPLAGVLSAHLEYPLQNIFVLACDMPLMDVNVLSRLYIWRKD
jgi:molybdopterin-guanine dinucleotide biosynthesis protein A